MSHSMQSMPNGYVYVHGGMYVMAWSSGPKMKTPKKTFPVPLGMGSIKLLKYTLPFWTSGPAVMFLGVCTLWPGPVVQK